MTSPQRTRLKSKDVARWSPLARILASHRDSLHGICGHAERPTMFFPFSRWINPECYTSGTMYARKLQAELVIGNERRPAPLDWLDSFCMRNFTGSAEFDDTLPTAEGRLEAGLAVDPQRLAQAMSEWFTKRGKGNGQPVTIELREVDSPK